MAEPEAGVREVYVQPGESHLVGDPVIFRTVLGSCVGVTFLVPRLGLGGICHPMLPSRPLKPESKLTRAESCRYVDFTIRDLAQQLDGLGALRNEVQVKLFGGGDVLLTVTESSRKTVGQLNCEAAIRVLREEGFEVVASSLGGTSGLNIKFHTRTGEVHLKRLDRR